MEWRATTKGNVNPGWTARSPTAAPARHLTSASLREDQRGIGANTDTTMEIQPVIPAGLGHGVIAGMTGEIRAIPGPVAVEPHAPVAGTRQANRVALVRAVGEVEHDDHVVTRAAAVPAVKGDDLVRVIAVEDIGVVALQAGKASTIAPHPDEVLVHPEDPGETLLLRPVERVDVTEPLVLEKLLALENHRDPGRRKDQHR